MKILFFDGHCSMCSAVVDWGMRHDQGQQVQFASLQGSTAYQKLPHSYLSLIETVVYLRGEKIYKRSDAILYFLKDMGGFWSCFIILLCIPQSIRDVVYHVIAKNRYYFFSKLDTCRVPTAEEKNRLLD